MLGRQLLRAATSVGGNYREARRARSRPEFAAKVGVCLQEADEAAYWLELLADSAIVTPSSVAGLLGEADELVAIFAASAKTSQRR